MKPAGTQALDIADRRGLLHSRECNAMKLSDDKLAATFDGTDDFLGRGAGLTGAADSRPFTVSVWTPRLPSPFPSGSVLHRIWISDRLARFDPLSWLKGKGGIWIDGALVCPAGTIEL